ncbi:hypothetical protein WICPIJ_006572 [Wickerhamomyces pijperi]|uniref:Transmembrane protein n=1 Tax=Wickerhamomyces pijperi TaxID=599730 RepID=A0A9P8Q415_WICPI|nr:hypothetical protein WICPIJ_006572 [Wickerhamomyces pijperi]
MSELREDADVGADDCMLSSHRTKKWKETAQDCSHFAFVVLGCSVVGFVGMVACGCLVATVDAGGYVDADSVADADSGVDFDVVAYDVVVVVVVAEKQSEQEDDAVVVVVVVAVAVR